MQLGGAQPGVAGAAPPPPPLLPSAAAADIEQQHLLALLRQPLFLQTPLQGLLEHLVQRVTSSAGASAELQRRVAALERADVGQDELLRRVRELEARSEAPAAAATPFAVVQLAGRVAELEKLGARLEEDGKALKYQASEVLERRVAAAEGRLAGVTNLAGRLMALDQVAEELGVDVPSMQHYVTQYVERAGGLDAAMTAAAASPAYVRCLSNGSSGGASCSVAGWSGAVTSSGLGSKQQAERISGLNLNTAAATDGPASKQGLDLSATVAADGSASARGPLSGSSGGANCSRSGAVPSKTRQELDELWSQLDVARAEGRAAQALTEQLQQQVASLSRALAEAEDRQSTQAAMLMDASQSLSDTMSAQMAGLRKELARPQEVSLAEFTRLQSALARAADEAYAAALSVKEVQEAESGLQKVLAELQRRVSRALGVRDCDKVLNDAIEGIKADVQHLQTRLDTSQAAALAGEGVATQSQLQELLSHMRGKASKEDLTGVLGRSVELALDAYRRAAGEAQGTGATRFKCLACDRELQEPPKTAQNADCRAPSPSASPPPTAAGAAAGAGWPPTCGPLPRMEGFHASAAPRAAASSAAAAQRGRRAASPPLDVAGDADVAALVATGSSGGACAAGEPALMAAAAGSGSHGADARSPGGCPSAMAAATAGSCPPSPGVGAPRPAPPAAGALPQRASTAAGGLRGAWTAGNARLTGSGKPRRGTPVFL